MWSFLFHWGQGSSYLRTEKISMVECKDNVVKMCVWASDKNFNISKMDKD